MVKEVKAAKLNREDLRAQIKETYREVALDPENADHFHVGRPLAKMLGYTDAEIESLPQATVESFAGTSRPFDFGRLGSGEHVLDLGCGAGFDTLLAAQQVGSSGRVIAVDMTEAMLEKTRRGALDLGLTNVDARLGYAENLPLEAAAVDVVISNGVLNLCPDKTAVLRELYRVLKPGGRLQIADMVVHREVPQEAKDDINLWSG